MRDALSFSSQSFQMLSVAQDVPRLTLLSAWTEKVTISYQSQNPDLYEYLLPPTELDSEKSRKPELIICYSRFKLSSRRLVISLSSVYRKMKADVTDSIISRAWR